MRILKILSTVIFIMSLAVPTFAQSSASGASGGAGAGGAGAAGGDTEASGGAMEGRGFSGRGPGETKSAFDSRVANLKEIMQKAEQKQARNLGIRERSNVVDMNRPGRFGIGSLLGTVLGFINPALGLVTRGITSIPGVVDKFKSSNTLADFFGSWLGFIIFPALNITINLKKGLSLFKTALIMFIIVLIFRHKYICLHY